MSRAAVICSFLLFTVAFPPLVRAADPLVISVWGGNEAILKEGLLVYTPPPGVKAEVAPSPPGAGR